MGRFWDLVKKYPVYVAAAVVALVVLIYVMSSSGDEGGTQVGTIVSMGPSDASVAANRDVTVAQMASNAMANQSANELEAYKYGVDASKVLAGIDAASYELMLGTTRDLAEISADRDVTISKDQTAGYIEIAKTSGATAAALAASRDSTALGIATAQTNASTNQAQIAANAATDMATIKAASDAAIAEAARQSAYAAYQQDLHMQARATAMNNINAALASSNPDEVAAGKAARAAATWWV